MATDIRIDTGPLAGAFRDMTASYKAFWFLALVDAAASRQLGATRERLVPFEEMRERMLQAAFWPAVRYRLSFGKSDRLYLRLAGLRDDDGNESLPPLKAERDRGILRHVPQRFLVPWIETKLVGVPQSRIDTAIRAVVETEFRTLGAVPYRILQDGIELDPAWHEFLVENYGVMRALGERELIRFLQARNPTIPGIPDKIAEARRGSLSEQTRFWRDAAEKKDMRCIYSGEPVLDDFSLDHFVPWSFVVHDRIWNLVPARKSINSSKGLRLPGDELVDRMCGMHLGAVRHAMGDPSFFRTTIAESYETDLRIDLRKASDDEFLEAQRSAVVPLVMQARRSGFPWGWSITVEATLQPNMIEPVRLTPSPIEHR